MTGRITRWLPGLGVGELRGVDGICRVFLSTDVATSAWPPGSAQDQLARPWVPAVGATVEFEVAPVPLGCLGPRAVLVRRRIIR